MTNITDAGRVTIQNLTYAPNANDNITGVTDAVTSANNQTLGYDNLDRLTSAAGSYGSFSYGYDGNGNRKSQNGTTWTYTANTNRLTAMGTVTVTPNANGSVTAVASSPALGFSYFKSSRLSTVTSGGGTVLTYLYDGFGKRLVETDTAQRFFQYDAAGNLLAQTDNLGSTARDYIYLNGWPVATFVPGGTAGTLSFLHTDRLGAPRRATSSTKAVGWSTEYQPFGSNTATVGSIANSLRQPGQEFEAATGHNQNGFRDYIPNWGRYLESDPIGLKGGHNGYVYSLSNPVKNVDRQGLLTAAQRENFLKDANQIAGGALEFVGGAAAVPTLETGIGAVAAFYGLTAGSINVYNGVTGLINDSIGSATGACPIAARLSTVPSFNDVAGDSLAYATGDPALRELPDDVSDAYGLTGGVVDKSFSLLDIYTQRFLNESAPSQSLPLVPSSGSKTPNSP